MLKWRKLAEKWENRCATGSGRKIWAPLQRLLFLIRADAPHSLWSLVIPNASLPENQLGQEVDIIRCRYTTSASPLINPRNGCGSWDMGWGLGSCTCRVTVPPHRRRLCSHDADFVCKCKYTGFRRSRFELNNGRTRTILSGKVLIVLEGSGR